MFRNLKQRVKNLSNSVHGRSNSRHGGSNDDSEKLNTPARQSTSVTPPNFSSNSPSTHTVSTSTSDNSNFQKQRHPGNAVRPPAHKPSGRRNNKVKNVLDIPLEDLDVVSKIEYLAPFDICVQASDELAAVSGISDHWLAKQADSVLSETRIDKKTGLPCASVLVSPDGYMLLIPPDDDVKDETHDQSQPAHNAIEDLECIVKVETSEFKNNKMLDNNQGENSSICAMEEEDVATVEGDQSERASFSRLRLHGKDDYASSVYVGHDLDPAGDKALNGFSAKGWSIPATSLALEQTEQSLNAFAHFCEQMILSRKESAARTAFACENLRRAATTIHHDKLSTTDVSGWVLIDPRAACFEMSPKRTGPLLAEGSTLASALASFEEYFVSEAEKEADKWRAASLQRDQVLPKIHDAVDQLHERSLKRRLALEESSRRVRVLEERVRALQSVADSKWEEVYDAEDRVTARQQQLMEERRQQKEKARLDKLRQAEFIRVQDSDLSGGDAAHEATSKEIWDIVASVVDASADAGSYEPIDFPSASPLATKEKSLGSGSFDDISVSSGASSIVPEVKSRDEIGMELGLPRLRAAAMSADDAVRDTADSLLNVLSSLDTTRRSARIAAETCLLSAANAQAACLKAWIQMERESLSERLAGLDAVEENIRSIFDIRTDLDAYITADKKERGGSSHLGDDDDGGIASALAILSSHVDGMERDSIECPVPRYANDVDTEDDGESDTIIEEAIDMIFDHHAELASCDDSDNDAKTRLTDSVEALCKVAAETSRAKRSNICYALNARRSTHARLSSVVQFDSLCRLFNAILTGCTTEVDVGSVSSAKMCMMLAQTFYMEKPATLEEAHSPQDRKSRIYVKNSLIVHPIWSKDEYW